MCIRDRPTGKEAEQLARELGAPTYAPNENGLIEVESKKKLAKRGVPSPNLADALVHTFKMKKLKPEPTVEPKRYEQSRKPASRYGK